MENVRPEGAEYQYVTYPSGEALGSDVHVRRSERIRNSPRQYNPEFGSAREWKNDDVASIVYIIQYMYLNSNVDTDAILSLLSDLDAEDFMYTPSTFHMK